MASLPGRQGPERASTRRRTSVAESQLAAIHRSHLVVEYDLEGVIRTANLNFLKLFGYTLDDLRGQHERVLVDDSWREGELHRKIWENLAAGQIQSGRYKRIGADGKLIWLHVTYSPVPGEGSRIVGVIACAIDVTEDELQRAEFAAQSAALGRAMAIIEYHADGTIADANDVLLRHLGYSRAELLGKPGTLLLQPGMSASREYAELWKQLRSGQARVARWWRVAKHGRESRVVATLVPVLDLQGQVRKVFEYSSSGSKRTEIDAPAQPTNTNFHDLFELCPVGMALSDAKSGELISVNDALLHQAGFTRDELVGNSFVELAPPKTMRSRAASASGRSKRIFDTYERELPRRDGGRYVALVAGLYFVDSTGRQLLWSIVQDISQRKAKEQELTLAARTDKLTGLVNRAEFLEKLQQALTRTPAAGQSPCAVLFLDLDNFKLINDTLGHDAGDSLLRQFADRIRATIRTQQRTRPLSANDTPVIARFGGDEFSILLLNRDDIAHANKLGVRLAEVGHETYQIAGREVQSTVSVGIVTSTKAGESAEHVMRIADAAMYEAKRKGRQRSNDFSETMQVRLARQVSLEDALRAAVGTDALSLDYQPIVDLATFRVVSAEALLRWRHPILGDVSPSEFVPVAENTGLILPIGDWVLREACRQFAAWRHEAPAHCPESISVNVSRAHLAQGNGLYALIEEILAEFDLPPCSVQLEVTEREVMRYPEFSLRTLESIHALGVKLAMDDFGTGASSLGCLRSYPFDTIKIDRSFLTDLEKGEDARSVLYATAALIRNLGMSAVAEGIERATQLEILQGMSVSMGQGYHLGPPGHADELLCNSIAVDGPRPSATRAMYVSDTFRVRALRS